MSWRAEAGTFGFISESKRQLQEQTQLSSCCLGLLSYARHCSDSPNLEENVYGIKKDGRRRNTWLPPQELCPSWLWLPWNGAGWLGCNSPGRDMRYACLRALQHTLPGREGLCLVSVHLITTWILKMPAACQAGRVRTVAPRGPGDRKTKGLLLTQPVLACHPH